MTRRNPFDPAHSFAQDVAFAEERILAKGELRMMFAVHGDERTVLVAPDSIADAEEKRAFFNVVRLLALAENAQALSSMCEGWMLGPDDRDEIARGIAPSESGKRQECVFVLLSYRDADKRLRHLSSVRKIIRRAGKVVGLHDDAMPSGIEPGGALAKLLPEREPPEHIRQLSRHVFDALVERLPEAFQVIERRSATLH